MPLKRCRIRALLPAIAVLILSASFGNAQTCCVTPSTETTTAAGQWLIELSVERFNQSLISPIGESFDGLFVSESSGGPGSNSCYFPGSAILDPNPIISGGTWSVAGGEVSGQHNHWGYDYIGWPMATVAYYRSNAPQHGRPLPCGFTIYQNMAIECSESLFWNYKFNVLKQTIYSDHLLNCRDGVCVNVSF